MWSKSRATDKGGGTTRDSHRRKNPGRRFAQIIKLKPECVQQYKDVHAAVWPEVLKQIKASNIEDCRFRVLCRSNPSSPLSTLRRILQVAAR